MSASLIFKGAVREGGYLPDFTVQILVYNPPTNTVKLNVSPGAHRKFSERLGTLILEGDYTRGGLIYGTLQYITRSHNRSLNFVSPNSQNSENPNGIKHGFTCSHSNPGYEPQNGLVKMIPPRI